MTYFLNKTDKEFLFRKYIKLGCTPEESGNNVKSLNEHLKFLVEKMKAQKRTELEINDKFRLEFEKICMKLEK